jgi:hypothetical protein
MFSLNATVLGKVLKKLQKQKNKNKRKERKKKKLLKTNLLPL